MGFKHCAVELALRRKILAGQGAPHVSNDVRPGGIAVEE